MMQIMGNMFMQMTSAFSNISPPMQHNPSQNFNFHMQQPQMHQQGAYSHRDDRNSKGPHTTNELCYTSL